MGKRLLKIETLEPRRKRLPVAFEEGSSTTLPNSPPPPPPQLA